MKWALTLLAVGLFGAMAHAADCDVVSFDPDQPGRDAAHSR